MMLRASPLSSSSAIRRAPPAAASVVAARRSSSALACRATLKDGPVRVAAAAAAAAVTAVALALAPLPALAGLNEREAELGGEFGNGTAQQWGEADIDGKDFSGQDLRRSNFTSTSCKKCNFRGTKLQGAYLIKAVVPYADFEGADVSDALWDRSVIVQANLRNAILQRVVFTRSDLTDAIIEGSDFTNSIVDKQQQIALCRYASGTNPVTGVDTRKSLGCGSKRRFAASSPSNPEGPQVSEDEKAAFRATMPVYRQ
jgi:hypothetical protein